MFKFTKFNTKQFCSVKKKQFSCLMLTRDGPAFVKNFLSSVGRRFVQNHGKKSWGITENHFYVNKFQCKAF